MGGKACKPSKLDEEELKEAKLIYETRGQVERGYLESEADAINAMF